MKVVFIQKQLVAQITSKNYSLVIKMKVLQNVLIQLTNLYKDVLLVNSMTTKKSSVKMLINSVEITSIQIYSNSTDNVSLVQKM